MKQKLRVKQIWPASWHLRGSVTLFANTQIIKHKFYTVNYNTTRNVANYVEYTLTKTEVLEERAKRKNNYRPDPLLLVSPRSSDYTRSGYDRGHLAPAEDFDYSKRAMSESFYMSNISPQELWFNRGIWFKLEKKVRKLAIQHKKIRVITGTVFYKDTVKIYWQENENNGS